MVQNHAFLLLLFHIYVTGSAHVCLLFDNFTHKYSILRNRCVV